MNTQKIAVEQVKKNNEFLNAVIGLQNVKNDAALSRALSILPPVISKIRHGRLPVSPLIMIRAHELTGMPFSDIRQFIPK